MKKGSKQKELSKQKMSVSKIKEYCKNGHLMSETRGRRKNGSAYCKECARLYGVKYWEKYSKKELTEKEKENKRIAQRKYLLRSEYGITIEEFNQMYTNQNGKCEICKEDIPSEGNKCHVDHDHETGKVRGLLCNTCNWTLGYTNDSIEILLSAITYLSKYKTV